MPYTHYKDGKWVKDKDFTISAMDLSVLRGFGVFDFLRTYKRKPFGIEEHVDRFMNSAELLEIPLDKSHQDLVKIIEEGIRRNPGGDLSVRMILTGGTSQDIITPGKPSLLMLYQGTHAPPEHYFKKGIKVITWEYPRSMPAAKSLDYFMAVKSTQHAVKVGAFEGLYIDPRYAKPQKIYEASTSNFFAVEKGVLVTPGAGILFGVTRKMVLELAHQLEIPVEIRDVYIREISRFDEAFITAANKDVLPVTKIDERTIGSGKPGQITKKLLKAYRELTNSL